MSAFGIPVMFDVEGVDLRDQAALTVADALVAACLMDSPVGRARRVVSWWLIDGRDKFADNNDNEAGRVVFDVDTGLSDALSDAIAGLLAAYDEYLDHDVIDPLAAAVGRLREVTA